MRRCPNRTGARRRRCGGSVSRDGVTDRVDASALDRLARRRQRRRPRQPPSRSTRGTAGDPIRAAHAIGPGVSMLGFALGASTRPAVRTPIAAPNSDGSAAPADVVGPVPAASAPIRPNRPMPTAPTHDVDVRRQRRRQRPRWRGSMMMPMRSANLSSLPNQSMASSLSHGGTRSITSLPTASIGETTSMMAATSMPMVTARRAGDEAGGGAERARYGGGRRLLPVAGCHRRGSSDSVTRS